MSELAVAVRSGRRRWALPGGRHDRTIAMLRVALPTGVGIIAAFLVLAPVFAGGDVSFVLDKNKVAVAEERLRIKSARYRGEDAKGQPFVLQAGSAVQRSSAEPIVQLTDLRAGIRLPEGPAQLAANRGRYNLETESVAVDGPIRFRTADGYVVETRDATVDLKTRRLTGTGAVAGRTPLGSFRGDRLTADLEGRIVRLEGNAHLRVAARRANRP